MIIIIPGTRKKVTIKMFQILTGTLTLIKDPIIFVTKINKMAISTDFANHLRNFTIITH